MLYSRAFTCARTLSATIRTMVTLGDECEEGAISFILSLQGNTLCLTPFPFDHARAEAFGERLVGALNSKSYQATVT